MSDHATIADPKSAVRDFWEGGSCGEVYARGASLKEQLDQHFANRYNLEPEILSFAKFEEGHEKDVLEVGVGMGADHLRWAQSRPRSLTGVDLTERAVEFTRARLELHGYTPNVNRGDAENLPFDAASFDIVYSWGVILCSPDTARCVREIFRVLRPGGVARVMIYSRWSMVGYMLWLRYALAAGRPWRSLTDIYAHHLESPGLQAFSVADTKKMFADFAHVEISTALSFGDLLLGSVGQRHQGPVLSLAKRLYPRWLIRALMKNHGLTMMIEARK